VALGPFSVMRKNNMELLLHQKFGQKLSIKASKGQKKFCGAEIVTLSSLVWNSVARNEK